MYNVILVGGMTDEYYGRALGPYRLRTALESNGYSVSILDYVCDYTEQHLLDILDKLVSSNTRILGISYTWLEITDSINCWASDAFFEKFRILYPWVKIVVGGNRNTVTQRILKNSDWFVSGFADISFPLLVDKIFDKPSINLKYFIKDDTRIVNSNANYEVKDVDTLETVFKKEDEYLPFQPITLEVSRGCIFHCAFCSHPFLGKKNFDYIRSSESLSRELVRNYELFGTTRYIISDDTFNDSIEKIDRVRQAIELAKLPKFEFVAYIKPELLITKPEMIPMLVDMGLKGAHFGVESFNKEARKVIGKGTPIEKILAAAEQLTSRGVKIHASFIIGLPGDVAEDYHKWNDYLSENVNKVFSSWWYNSLGIGLNPMGEGYSLIEQDPEKYGYTIIPHEEGEDIGAGDFWRNWIRADGMRRWDAFQIAKELNEKNRKIVSIAGWRIAAAWNCNLSEDELQKKSNTHFKAWYIYQARAAKKYKDITGDDISWM